MKINYILSLWLFLALLAVQPAGRAQDAAKTGKDASPSAVTVESSFLPKENVTLATDVKWTIKVNLPEGYALPSVEMPKNWGTWTIAASETLQTSPTSHEIRLTLRPTKLGKQVVPDFPVNYKDKSGKPGYVEVKSFNIDVVSKVHNASNLRGMESQNDPIAIRKMILPYILAALVGMVIVVLMWSTFFKRKQTSEAETPQNPYELAMERIKALMDSGLAQRDVKMFCVELTNIVREFIEKTTSINAPELTTEEFLNEISQSNIFTEAECVQLKHFLELADMVKFAKYDLGETCRNMAKSAVAFIRIEREQGSRQETAGSS